MRWIDDLEPAYHKYSSTYLGGFDSFSGVTRNILLPDILLDISSSNPPPAPLEQWTLDALFLLPFTRLRYYRKLYARLLRSTKEGRSDHRLLVVANQRLEALVELVEGRLDMDVSDGELESPDRVGGSGLAQIQQGQGMNGQYQHGIPGSGSTSASAVQRTSAAGSMGTTSMNGHGGGSAPGSVGGRSRETSWAEAEREKEKERQSRASSGMGSSQGSKTE